MGTQAGIIGFNQKNKTKKVESIFDHIVDGRDRKRVDSVSYDAIEPNIKYEREVSRDGTSILMNELDPLSMKNNNNNKHRTASVQPLLPPVNDTDNDEEQDSMSDLSDNNGNNENENDSMSDLSADHGTFIIHGDTLKKEMDKERKKKKKMKKKKQMVQLMNCEYILQIVPDSFTIINDFIINKLSDK